MNNKIDLLRIAFNLIQYKINSLQIERNPIRYKIELV